MNPHIRPEDVIEVELDRPRKLVLNIGALKDTARALGIDRVDPDAILGRAAGSNDLGAMSVLAWAMLRQCDPDLKQEDVDAMLTMPALKRFAEALGAVMRAGAPDDDEGGARP